MGYKQTELHKQRIKESRMRGGKKSPSRAIYPRPSKICLLCNQKFLKPLNLGKGSWEKKKLCSNLCRYKFQIGIPRSLITRKKIGLGNSGEKSAMWKGGRCTHSGGYIAILSKNHPNCDAKGYMLKHRLVMEKKIGRFLKKHEIVHHISGIKDDNRIENLMLCFSKKDHISKHHPYNTKETRQCSTCKLVFKLNKDNFYRRGKNKLGYYCKKCQPQRRYICR